jgi:hypothetical protein
LPYGTGGTEDGESFHGQDISLFEPPSSVANRL